MPDRPSNPEEELIEEKYTPDQQDQILKLQAFFTKFKEIIEAWGKTHPGQAQPPIVWDETVKDFRWQNRKERRS